MKKILFLFIVLTFGFLAVACQDSDVPVDTKITLLDLVGKTETEIELLYAEDDLTITFVDVESETVDAGKFIRYKSGYQAGDKVEKGTSITIEIAVAPVTTFELLDITGRTQAQIVVLYEEINVTLVFETVETNDISAGRFVAYEGYNIGDEVELGSTITIQLATPIVVVIEMIELPDLTGMTQEEIETTYSDLDVDFTFVYQNSSTIEDNTFISYVGYSAGSEVEEGTAVTIRVATPGPTIVGALDMEVFVSVQGNPPTFDLSEGVSAYDYLGNEITFGGGFFYIAKIENAQGVVLDDVNYYQLGEYTVFYEAINSLKKTVVERVITIIVPPFDTNYTDDLRLTASYEGLSFINDGIGEVTVTSFTDGDTTNFRDHIAGISFTVRYLGIDTPEATSQYDPWGIKAGNSVREKLSGAEKIILQTEDINNRQDGNGRWLAWVWYIKDGESRLLNLELVEEAYAWTSGAVSTQYGSVFQVAQAETQLTGKRIYGEVDPDYDYSSEGTPVDIAYLLANFEDYYTRKVIVSGIITSKVGNSVYLEDDGYGIFMYAGYQLTNELQIGHEVTIQGLVATTFNGSPQLSNYKMENMVVISEDNEVVITTINGDQLGSYVARVVRLENLEVISIYQSPTNNAYNVKVEDAFGNQFDIRIDDYAAAFIPKSLFVIGSTILWVQGPVSQFNDFYQLLLPGLGNIEFE
jgi:endonuclease YncB( thermonuclease family)/beta-lactam-binding protein with PASTA domain